jgi:hypothetical protein
MAACVLNFYRDADFVSPVATLAIPAGVPAGPHHNELQRFWIHDELGNQVGMVYVKHRWMIQLTGFRKLPQELYCWRTEWMDSREETIECLRAVCTKLGIIVRDSTKDTGAPLFETADACFHCNATLWTFVELREHGQQEVCLGCGVRYRYERFPSMTRGTYADMDMETDLKPAVKSVKLEWQHNKVDQSEDSRLVERKYIKNELQHIRSEYGRVYINNQLQVIGTPCTPQ